MNVLYQGLLTEWGESLGLGQLIWPDSGVITLSFEQRGTLYLEQRDTALLVYLARELDRWKDTLETLKLALRMCHYRENLPYPVQVGLKGESSLVFSVRFNTESTTLPELEYAVELLTRLHQQVQA